MSFESFLGSVWFAVMLAFAGYVAGNLFPLKWIASLIRKG